MYCHLSVQGNAKKWFVKIHCHFLILGNKFVSNMCTYNYIYMTNLWVKCGLWFDSHKQVGWMSLFVPSGEAPLKVWSPKVSQRQGSCPPWPFAPTPSVSVKCVIRIHWSLNLTIYTYWMHVDRASTWVTPLQYDTKGTFPVLISDIIYYINYWLVFGSVHLSKF